MTTEVNEEEEEEDAVAVVADDDEERRPPSSRVRWDAERGRSVFEGIEQGAFHANLSDLSDVPTPDEFKYDDEYEIMDDGKPVGTIAKFLGQGAMGTVHLFQPSGGWLPYQANRFSSTNRGVAI